jgi:hypothetical protein
VTQHQETTDKRNPILLWTVVGLFAAATMAGALLAWDRLFAPDDDGEPNPGVLEGAEALDWSVGPATLGWFQQVVNDGNSIYVLSTAPGAGIGNPVVPKAIWSSKDGKEWTPHVLDEPWVTRIAAVDGLLYAVGTAPGAVDPSARTVQVGVSSDDGETFDISVIPASTPEGGGVPDPQIGVVGDGVVVFGLGSQTFFSPQGGAFQEVEYPFGDREIGQVSQVGHELFAYTYALQIEDPQLDAGSVMRSEDGRTWSDLELPGGLSWASAIGEVGGRTVLVGYRDRDGAVLAVEGEGTWQVSLVSDLLGVAPGAQFWVGESSVGDHGVAMILTAEVARTDGSPLGWLTGLLTGTTQSPGEGRDFTTSSALLYSPDLVNWSLYPAAEMGGSTLEGLVASPHGITVHSVGVQNNLLFRQQAVATWQAP